MRRVLSQVSRPDPQLNQAPELSLTSGGTVYHGKDSAVLSCGVTANPPPLNITWRLSWLGEEEEEELVTDYSSPHLRVNMSASTSSQLTATCSASNFLGSSTSNSLTLYVVGEKIDYTG